MEIAFKVIAPTKGNETEFAHRKLILNLKIYSIQYFVCITKLSYGYV